MLLLRLFPGILILLRRIVQRRLKLLIAIHIAVPARLFDKGFMLPTLGNVPVL